MPSFIWSMGRTGFLGVRVFSIWNGSFAVGDTSITAFGRALVAINCPFPLFETMKVQYFSEERSSPYHPGFGAAATSSVDSETRYGSASYILRSTQEHSPGFSPPLAGVVP